MATWIIVGGVVLLLLIIGGALFLVLVATRERTGPIRIPGFNRGVDAVPTEERPPDGE